jgi:tetratricopeptide (TPR) repeat protein
VRGQSSLLSVALASAFAAIVPQAAFPFGDKVGAGPCSIATNGSATGNVVNCGDRTLNVYNRDPEALQLLSRQLDRSEEYRRAAEAKAGDLAHQLDLSNVTVQTVLGFLRVLADTPALKVEDVPAKMAEITANYERWQQRVAAFSSQDPGVADLARQAAEAGIAGHFEEADRLLEQAEIRETAAIDEHRVKAAELRAARGDNAATQLHYANAARHFEDAAALLASNVSITKGVYLTRAGDLWQTSGDLAAALTSYQAALDIVERLAAADPEHAAWQRDRALSHIRIGDVQQAQNDRLGALQSYRAALAIRQQLLTTDPGNAEWWHGVAVSWGRIGDVQRAQGDLAAAIDSYQASFAIIKRLAVVNPSDAEMRRNLEVSQERIGETQLAQGNQLGALASYQAALEIAERLAEADRSNGQRQSDLAILLGQIGDVQQEQGDLAAALTSCQKSLAIVERLAEADPENAQLQRHLSFSLGQIGDVYRAQGDLAAARGFFTRALETMQEMQRKGRLAPSDRGMLDDLANRIAALTK